MRLWVLFIFAAGCAHGGPTRGPALEPGGAELTASESEACNESPCKTFVAPCSLKEHSPQYRAPDSVEPLENQGLKETAYLDEFEDYMKRGYCQLQPRLLSEDWYNRDTCLYIFVRRERCTQ